MIAKTSLHQAPRSEVIQTPSMRLAMRILSARVSAIRQFATDLAKDNPSLEAHLPELPMSQAGAVELDGFASEDVRATSLTHHVSGQINQIFDLADDRYLATAMIPYLSSAGWLDQGAESDLERVGFKADDIARVLKGLQSMTPAGLWARNLRECLALQCKDRDVWSDDIALVLDHLDAFLSGDIGAATGLPELALSRALAEIKRCNPKPGAMFLYEEGDIFTPDLIITSTASGLEVTVNQEGMPTLKVIDEGRDDEAQKLLLEAGRKQVSALQQAIQNRAAMLLKAGQILAHRQGDFLTKGEGFIAPFSMTELAAEIGCHKSTISRLVADKLVQTPLGMMEMNLLFASSLKQPDGGAVAGRAVRAKIVNLMNDEAQWTDQMLAAHLKSEGILIARRTVNKYRLTIHS